ncbi:N-6 DNA methylase [Nostoc sp. WHI]|uniref:N-6 DNA methylase n=1 Tax=Nostoc sp. WHI TaxID=2650611 RepID=UPI0018C71670|nr:N-6 DNA methylase [Nostoc sp. WHI]MBG1264936.1 N-6 DNA methylase [Nostoc sp. WHI]
MARQKFTQAEAEAHPLIRKAIERGVIEIKKLRVIYYLDQKKDYEWTDPEEWVRAYTIAYLVLEKGYPPYRMRTEVKVPRRTPNDWADIVVYRDDRCKEPYLVAECKSDKQSVPDQLQGIEQLFGNANSLRAPLGLYEEYSTSIFYDVANYPAEERKENSKGYREVIPVQYGEVPEYAYIAGLENNDIQPVKPKVLETRIRRAHSIIWAGGRRDPLTAFDEWSKLLFAKVEDERTTPNRQPRKFQVGTNETTTTVATRIHELFEQACRNDTTIFPEGIRIRLPDRKVYEVVRVLQDVSITSTAVDSIGAAFESFFGSVFRGELGQYFTMRQLARFSVAMLNIAHTDFVIDLTAGSGGFLLEVLLQVWHNLNANFAGRRELDRYKNDFALHKVFGIEIHEILARICKINLLLHHDGHTNIEGDRSCLDSTFTKERLQAWHGRFTCVVGNPPFGDEVEEGDDDLLGTNLLSNFDIAEGRSSIPSEHVILERAIDMLEGGGRLALILPDGLFNNQGEISNCPRTRRFLAKNGFFEAIVSLPDYAFRKSGAQNKTSILFYRKFIDFERTRFQNAYNNSLEEVGNEEDAILAGLHELDYKVFLAEAHYIGYTTTGASSERNDLYRGFKGGNLNLDQSGTILGQYRRFKSNPVTYDGHRLPDCMSIYAGDMWSSHESHRLDPKYHLFKQEERNYTPSGWVRLPLSKVMQRRAEEIQPASEPDTYVVVMTLAQTGDIRPREAGKGNNPPEWLGMYFEDSSSTWYKAYAGDLVFSSIDLWKGCIAIVPDEFNEAIVTKEFPIYQITDLRLNPEFLSCLLRSRYYQRAFRAITTGHSNRRRTQVSDFERLEICFPENEMIQRELTQNVLDARINQREAANSLKQEMLRFSDVIDGRGDEDYGDDIPDDEHSENE